MDDWGNELPGVTRLQINHRLDKGSERMAAIERELGETRQELGKTRQELHELKLQLTDLLAIFVAMTGALKVFNWVGKLARPAAAIVALGVALVGAWNAYRGLK